MAIYNAYLEGAEREAAILDMELDNQYNKLSMLYEMSVMELEQVKKDLELKVFRESGTYDDLEYLIKEAEEQAQPDQQNILSQILNWFANVIQKMITSIKNFFAGAKQIPDDTEAEVALPDNEGGMFQTIDGILNSVAGMDGKITIDGVIKIVGASLGLSAGALAVIDKINKDHPIKTRIMKWAAMKKLETMCNTSVGKLNGIITNVITKIQDSTVGKFVCDNVLRPVQQKCQEIIDTCSNAVNVFKAKVGGGANAQAAQPAADANAKPATNNGPATVTGAKVEGAGDGARIVAAFTDNTSGQPVNRKAYLDKNGKITGSADGKPVPANAKSLIEGSPAVKNAVARITKTAERNAMKNSPQAQLATGTQTANQNKPANTQTVNKESAEELQMELGDGYTVETTEDGIDIIIKESFDIPEDYLSTTQSIFGMVAEEEASEDPELEELQKLFTEL